MSHAFHRGGQLGWAHDEGHTAGVFHTYDHLDVSREISPRRVHVFLPRGAETSGRRYPTIYFHDGDTTFWPGGVARKTWDVAGTLSNLKGRVDEAIVVAVTPQDRNAEYTHVDWAHGQRPWGRLPAHADYLADGVKRFVDEVYPTLREPKHNVVVGSSHGGLAAFWTATRRPDAFGKAACLSPSFFSGLDSLTWGAVSAPLEPTPLVAGAAGVLSDPIRRPTFWMCWGTRRDGGDHNRVVEALAALRGAEMADLLVRRFGYVRQDFASHALPSPGANLFVAIDQGAGHDEDAWRRRFGWAMRAFFPRRSGSPLSVW